VPPSDYDKSHIREILNGEGDWFSAHLLRFLDTVLFRSDTENLYKLWKMYPEHCTLIYRTYGWSSKDIVKRVALSAQFLGIEGNA
jgi:hypothetical protein